MGQDEHHGEHEHHGFSCFERVAYGQIFGAAAGLVLGAGLAVISTKSGSASVLKTAAQKGGFFMQCGFAAGGVVALTRCDEIRPFMKPTRTPRTKLLM